MSGSKIPPEFHTAVKESRQLKTKPSDNDLLELYALYKQTLQDPPFEKSEKPGMFDLKGKAKRNAWQQKADQGMSPGQAAKEYIALVNKLKNECGFDPSKPAEAVGGK